MRKGPAARPPSQAAPSKPDPSCPSTADPQHAVRSVRFVAVSATIPNVRDIADWLRVPEQGLKLYGAAHEGEGRVARPDRRAGCRSDGVPARPPARLAARRRGDAAREAAQRGGWARRGGAGARGLRPQAQEEPPMSRPCAPPPPPFAYSKLPSPPNPQVRTYPPCKNDFLFERRLDSFLPGLLAEFSEGKPSLVFCRQAGKG
jgi:hypothetical protein